MAISSLEIQNAIGALGRLDRAAPVILGGLVLSGPEVPDQLVFGGRQRLVIHHALGGGRVVDAVGNDPLRLVLSGCFIGPLATQRTRSIEAMRRKARSLVFSVADLTLRVWIAEFSWAYQARGTICPYQLVLEREDAPSDGASSSAEEAGGAMATGSATLSGFLGQMAEIGWVGNNAIAGLAGQIMPLAQGLGVGGTIARVQDRLGQAGALWQTVLNGARIPSALRSVSSSLSLAVDDLDQTRGENETILDTQPVNDASDLLVAARSTGALAMSVDAGNEIRLAHRLVDEWS